MTQTKYNNNTLFCILLLIFSGNWDKITFTAPKKEVKRRKAISQYFKDSFLN